MHKFVVMKNGVLHTYTRYESIPKDFDHVIEFVPDIPDGDAEHTEQEHKEIELWTERLTKLMEIENARSNKSR